MTSRLPPPSPLKQPEAVLHEEQHDITLEGVQNLYESIARRTQAVLHANVIQLVSCFVLIKKCVSVITNSIILSTPVTVNTALQVPIQQLNFNTNSMYFPRQQCDCHCTIIPCHVTFYSKST